MARVVLFTMLTSVARARFLARSMQQQLEASQCAHDQGVDHFGGDYMNLTVSSAEDCCDACHKNYHCAISVYWEGICYLKNVVNDATVSEGRVSFRPPRTPPTPSTAQCMVSEDTDYVGGDYANIATNSLDACCDACTTDSSCRVAVLFQSVCYLKNSDARVDAALSKGRIAITPPPSMIKALQWNPHYQCMYEEASTCRQDALNALNHELVDKDIDFANVVDFTGYAWAHPYGWKSNLYHQPQGLNCGNNLTLAWNGLKYDAYMAPSVQGCIESKYPFIVQNFYQNTTGWSVTVVAASSPPPDGRGVDAQLQPLAKSIADVLSDASYPTEILQQDVIIMADTNQESSLSSESLLAAVGLAAGETSRGTDLFGSCCYSKTSDGFTHAYDRVISNFGMDMETVKVFDPPPSWAGSEFHIGVVGVLKVA